MPMYAYTNVSALIAECLEIISIVKHNVTRVLHGSKENSG